MKTNRFTLAYEAPMDIEILEAYIHKNNAYNRNEARKVRKALRKLRYV